MPKTKILIALSILIITSLACNASLPGEPTATPFIILEPTNPPQPGDLPLTEADVPRVSLEKALTALSAGAATFVDVRGPDAFAASHISGAMNLPLNVIEPNPAGVNLNKEEWIITYCTWTNEHLSARAAFLMLHAGFKNVTPLLGGFEAWINAGYPVEP